MTARTARLVCSAVAATLVLAGCSGSDTGDGTDDASDATVRGATCEATAPEELVPEVLETRPHDATSYTQGLLVRDGVVFESAGRYGESRLVGYDLATGDDLVAVDLPEDVFAEGLALVGDDELVQLTWKEGVAYRWDVGDLLASRAGTTQVEPTGELRYDGEGWGLTEVDDGTLVMSDGSDTLVVRDPEDFAELGAHRVERDGGPSDALNELDWDGESLWANRYQSDELLRIDPDCWTVTGVVDLSSLRDDAAEAGGEQDVTIDVTNGVAHLDDDEFLVTGKWWPTSYRVRFVPA